MQLIPSTTSSSMRRFTNEFSKMLSQFPGFENEETSLMMSDWAPAVDVKEEKKRFRISVDIPGVDPKDVDVTMENGMLTIKGERSDEIKEDREGYHRVERSSGSFFRRFVMPDTADAKKLKAYTKNGVLHIVIGKKKARNKRAKKIKVKS